MDPAGDLRLLLASRHPVILATTDDEARFMAVLRRAASLAGFPVWTWSLTHGLSRDGRDPQFGTTDPRKALAFIAALPDPGVFVMADVRAFLDDPAVVREVKEFGLAAKTGQTLVLTGATSEVPPELEGLALPWSLEPPSTAEIDGLVRRALEDLAARGIPVSLDAAARTELVTALRGLTLPEAERLVLQAALRSGRLGAEDLEAIRGMKAELFEAEGLLELVGPDVEGLDDVGGMEHLKEWLRVRGTAFEPEASDFGIEPPRGILLTGVPGCGKSLVAKAVARAWRLPLVLLDPGRLYGSFVGESERRLERALGMVEAMAPLVLWVDEIEKGFAAGSGLGDSGVSSRVLGSFLRWMQDRPSGVFVVATCNDVEALPAELVRRGRFDELFFVDLPDEPEREAILRVQLRRHKRDPATFDVAGLAASAEGFSGAELEGAVVAAMYRAYADRHELTTEDVAAEIHATSPLSMTRAEDVERLRAWADGRAVRASG